MPKIFICYRRQDSSYAAHQIYGVLTKHFGPESVTFDVDTIPPGTDFREYLNTEVSKCDILLAIMGDQWKEILKERMEEPNDFVRIEIHAALERGIPLVPILVDRASVPSEKELPPELSNLAYRQALEVRAGPDLESHLKRLIVALDRVLTQHQSRRKIDKDLVTKAAQKRGAVRRQQIEAELVTPKAKTREQEHLTTEQEAENKAVRQTSAPSLIPRGSPPTPRNDTISRSVGPIFNKEQPISIGFLIAGYALLLAAALFSLYGGLSWGIGCSFIAIWIGLLSWRAAKVGLVTEYRYNKTSRRHGIIIVLIAAFFMILGILGHLI